MKTHIDKARAIARIAHHGQVDKIGKPYFGHVARVANGVFFTSPLVRAAGYLHDVLEDTHITADDLRDLGVDPYTITLVEILTRGEDEKYFDYIDRIKLNDAATLIKLADLEDNLDESRWPGMPESMKSRYLKAKSILEEMK